MGSELLTQPTLTQVFEDACPFYLAIGMSLREYWEGDASLPRYFRKAYRIKQDEMNNNAWLQGVYIYDAISTAMHNALRDPKKSRAREYAKEPYNFRHTEKTEQEKAKEVAVEQQKAAAWMDRFVRMNNPKSQSHRA